MAWMMKNETIKEKMWIFFFIFPSILFSSFISIIIIIIIITRKRWATIKTVYNYIMYDARYKKKLEKKYHWPGQSPGRDHNRKRERSREWWKYKKNGKIKNKTCPKQTIAFLPYYKDFSYNLYFLFRLHIISEDENTRFVKWEKKKMNSIRQKMYTRQHQPHMA